MMGCSVRAASCAVVVLPWLLAPSALASAGDAGVIDPTRMHAAGLCLEEVSAAAQVAGAGSAIEMEARHRAIESWRERVKVRFGAQYAHWWKSFNRRVVCAGDRAGAHCEVLAAPCAGIADQHAPGRASY